jgi:hypothetical protein
VAKLIIMYLVITGIGAFLALAVPGLVILGFFALIIPGLILSLMPTAFLYGAIFAAAWFVARMAVGEALATVAGIVTVGAFVTAAVMPTRTVDMAAYRASLLKEVTPGAPIALKGHVRFDLLSLRTNKTDVPGYKYVKGQAGFACEGWCLAALFTPGVTAVTLNQWTESGDLSPEARTYRLAKRPGCVPNVAIDPNDIRSPVSNQYEDGKLLSALWAMKLASDYCLIMSAASDRPDFTVVQRNGGNGARPGKWSFGPGSLRTETIEIFEDETLVHRAHQSSITTLASFLYIEPTGGIENFRFGWGRKTTNSKGGYDAVTLAKSMERHADIAGKAVAGSAKDKSAMLPALRRQLSEALNDPALTEKSPAFKVMEAYFEAVGGTASDEDVALISRIVADPRLSRIEGAWHLKLPNDQARAIYDAYTARVVAAGAPAELGRSLMQQFVANQGADSIRLIGPAQEALLADPSKRLAVPELVKALGYGEAGNAPRLLAMLKTHAGVVTDIQQQRQSRAIGSYDRQAERDANLAVMGAAESGLCLLGPRASAVRDELDAFLTSGVMPQHMVEGHSQTDWNVILARMGKPIEAFAKPERMSGSEENYRRNLRAKVERWKPGRC